MRFSLKSAGVLDLATGALILGGLVLIAVSLVAASLVLHPAGASVGPGQTPLAATPDTPSAGQVATILLVDAAAGAGGAVQSGDHIDVLGYFSRQVLGSESVTRVLLPDVQVLTVDRAGAQVALTLALPQDRAVLLQEALAIGARPFVTLRSLVVAPEAAAGVPLTFSDTDLAQRLAERR